jgi:hypothetical protein
VQAGVVGPLGRCSLWRGFTSVRVIAAAAIAVFVAAVASWTLVALDLGLFGFDFLAYQSAARRLLAGESLYDMHFATTAVFGLYYYPPPFVVLVLPLALGPPETMVWAWFGLLIAAVVGGIMLMPISTRQKWLILLLAGSSFPVSKALVLGQVGPLLLLFFALGWRWLSRDGALAATAAIGAMVKVQPLIVFVWAALVRRWAVVAIGAVLVGLVAAITTLTAGTQSWIDWVTLLLRVGDPVSQVENVNLGALARQAGLDREVAVALHWLGVGLAAVVWLWIAVHRAPIVGYLATVVTSQLFSPILWDHYAMVLLVPVAWLLSQRVWWAGIVPLLSPWFLGASIPHAVSYLSFWATLALLVLTRAPAAEGGRETLAGASGLRPSRG